MSVTGGVHNDLVKRVLRDIQRAGQEPEAIIQQISETVCPLCLYNALIMIFGKIPHFWSSYMCSFTGLPNVQGLH